MYSYLTDLFEIELIICIKMDLNTTKLRTYDELVCLNWNCLTKLNSLK